MNMNFDILNSLRKKPGASPILYLTDMCPVGCAHCSVDAKKGSSSIHDRLLLMEVIKGIANFPKCQIVAVTGGEPFAEREALETAVNFFKTKNKKAIIYTSGIALKHNMPNWVANVLDSVEGVVLSTDSFHLPSVPISNFIDAACHCVERFGKVLIQMVKDQETEFIVKSLEIYFGGHFHEVVEIKYMPLTSMGRAKLRETGPTNTAASWCGYLNSPVVRYDGVVLACCNENIIRGFGPKRLRINCSSAEEITSALDRMLGDSLNHAIATVGPAFASKLKQHSHCHVGVNDPICDGCWKLQQSAGDYLAHTELTANNEYSTTENS